MTAALVPKLTAHVKESTGMVAAPPRALIDLTGDEVTREDLLERIDPDELKSSRLNLLLMTAISVAQPDVSAATEDAVIRYVVALTAQSSDTADLAYLRLTAEKLVLADVEYQSAATRYVREEGSAPCRADWSKEATFLEAGRLHERRMERMLRDKREAFDRYVKAGEVYRVALGKASHTSGPASAPAQPAYRPMQLEEGESPVPIVKNIQIVVKT